MGLLCLTPDTTPNPLVLKEHLGWTEGQAEDLLSAVLGTQERGWATEKGIRVEHRCCPAAAGGLLRVTQPPRRSAQ